MMILGNYHAVLRELLLTKNSLDTSDYSFGYIGGWSKDKEVSELKESLDIIKTTADEISKKIEEALSEIRVKEETETVTMQHRAKTR